MTPLSMPSNRQNCRAFVWAARSSVKAGFVWFGSKRRRANGWRSTRIGRPAAVVSQFSCRLTASTAALTCRPPLINSGPVFCRPLARHTHFSTTTHSPEAHLQKQGFPLQTPSLLQIAWCKAVPCCCLCVRDVYARRPLALIPSNRFAAFGFLKTNYDVLCFVQGRSENSSRQSLDSLTDLQSIIDLLEIRY